MTIYKMNELQRSTDAKTEKDNGMKIKVESSNK